MAAATASIILDPSWIKGHLRRASIFFRVGDMSKARDVRLALRLQPDNLDAKTLADDCSRSERVTAGQLGESELVCPICFREMLDPWQFVECKHMQCFDCARQWADTSETCPMCRGSGKHFGPLPKRVGGPYYAGRVARNPSVASNWYNLGAKCYPLLHQSGFASTTFSRMSSDCFEVNKDAVMRFMPVFGMEPTEPLTTTVSSHFSTEVEKYEQLEVEYYQKYPVEKAKEASIIRLMAPELFRVALVLDPSLGIAWFKLAESSQIQHETRRARRQSVARTIPGPLRSVARSNFTEQAGPRSCRAEAPRCRAEDPTCKAGHSDS